MASTSDRESPNPEGARGPGGGSVRPPPDLGPRPGNSLAAAGSASGLPASSALLTSGLGQGGRRSGEIPFLPALGEGPRTRARDLINCMTVE